jgi:AraC family transcriptional regulator
MYPGACSTVNRYLREEYTGCINRVQDYIEKNIQNDFTLEELAEVAHFSKYHFHRIFHSMAGETLFQFIQRLRVEKAAVQLLNNPKKTITEIAMTCGFSSSAAFARVFKDNFGVSAGAWRRMEGRTPEIVTRVEQQREVGGTVERGKVKPVTVEIEEAPELSVVYIRYSGPFQGDTELFSNLYRRLFTWAGARSLYVPGENRVFCVIHDNPSITDDSRLRVSCCLTVPKETVPEGEIGSMTLSAGTYAKAEFLIGDHDYGWAWASLFGDWLPASGYQPDDRPAFEEYLDTEEGSHSGEHHVLLWLPVMPL